MPIAFEHTVRSLAAERSRAGLVALALGLVVLAGWGAWFVLAEVAVYVPAGPGRVELDRPVHPVQAEVGGRLLESRLALGAAVAAGEVLLRLDDRETRSRLDEETARRAALVARRATRGAERAARAAAEAPAVAAEAAAVAEARARVTAARAAAALAADEARRAGAVSAVVAAGERARLSGEAARAEAAVDEARQSARRVEAEGASRAAERAAALAAMDAELAALDGEVAQADARLRGLSRALEGAVIRAPADGRLMAIEPRGVGAVIGAGEVLGQVAGAGALRVVAVFPVDRALGRVAVGQRARVRFDSFAWTRYGTVAAVVTGVAGEGSGGGLRVELRPEASGHAVPLQHGLTGRVEVEVERVAPVELVLAALGRAIAP